MFHSNIKCVTFDCFGTVFDMSGISKSEISDYVRHVRKNDFSPFTFPDSWFNLKAHPDSAEGISLIQSKGIKCVALSNGSLELIKKISEENKIYWDFIINLVGHKVYKPNVNAYYTVKIDTGFNPEETLMVTANPTFGDVEGSQVCGMKCQVIRHGPPETIIDLNNLL